MPAARQKKAGRKAFRHRVECHDREGKFLGAAEFKSADRRSEPLTRRDLLSRIRVAVRDAEQHVMTWSINESVVL